MLKSKYIIKENYGKNVEEIMSTEIFNKAIDNYAKIISNNLDDIHNKGVKVKDIERTLKELHYYNKVTYLGGDFSDVIKILQPPDVFKFYANLSVKLNNNKLTKCNNPDHIINRSAEINLLKTLRKLGDDVGNLETDFLVYAQQFEQDDSIGDGVYEPYRIDFKIVIGEEELNSERLGKNEKDIKNDETKKKNELRKILKKT